MSESENSLIRIDKFKTKYGEEFHFIPPEELEHNINGKALIGITVVLFLFWGYFFFVDVGAEEFGEMLMMGSVAIPSILATLALFAYGARKTVIETRKREKLSAEQWA